MTRIFLAGLVALCTLAAQQAQNPSPMVEHTRAHTRLAEQTPAGRREPLSLGTLFIPKGMKANGTPLLVFFHGGEWIAEVAAARNGFAVVSVQAGAGSASYARLFEDPRRFTDLLAEADEKAGGKFGRVTLGGWSAGCGAVREILKTPAAYARVSGALVIDGMHADYADAKAGAPEPELSADNVEIWEQLGRDAKAGRKRFLVTHSEIFPGTYASTTETADYLLARLKLKGRAVLKWGPVGMQQLSEASAGKFLLLGFAGNSAPDHLDQLHALPAFLKRLR